MRRFILLAMMLAVAVSGCDRFPHNGLQISALLPPDSDCLFSADQEARLLHGRWDVEYRTADGAADYIVAPLLESYLVSTALEFQGEQANLQVTNLEITILLPDGTLPDLGGLVNPYRVNTSAVLPANLVAGTSTTEVAAAIGIPGSYLDAVLAALGTDYSQVLLDIRAIGTTFGGFTQRSAPLRFPVEICSGCLNDCTREDLADSCLPGQDLWFYCI